MDDVIEDIVRIWEFQLN